MVVFTLPKVYFLDSLGSTLTCFLDKIKWTLTFIIKQAANLSCYYILGSRLWIWDTHLRKHFHFLIYLYINIRRDGCGAKLLYKIVFKTILFPSSSIISTTYIPCLLATSTMFTFLPTIS